MLTTQSYTSGIGDKSLWHVTLPDLLDQRAKEYPEKDIHVFWEAQDQGTLLRESITYRDLSERSYNVAASLLDLGLEPGDRMAIVADNCPEWLLIEYAALRCKLLLVRIPPADVTPKVLMHYIVKHQCKAIVVDGRRSDKVTRLAISMFLKAADDCDCHDDDDEEDEDEDNDDEEEEEDGMSSRVIGLKDEPGSRLLTVKDMADPEVEHAKVKEIQNSINPDDVAIVLTTSDSAGVPKLVQQSHFAVINNARCVEEKVITDDLAVYYNCSPFFWIGSNMYASVSFGITMVHAEQASQDNVDHMYALLHAEKVSVGKFMPAFLEKVYKKSTKKGKNIMPSTMQYIITGGAGLNEEVTIYYQRQYKGIMQIYGTTETMSVANNIRTCHDTGSEFWPLANVEMKVVNVNGAVLPLGQPGRLLVKSPFTFSGYLDVADDMEENAERESDQRAEYYDEVILGNGEVILGCTRGWYITKDVAVIGPTGGATIIGRSKDVIRHGSIKIYPSLFEKQLKDIDSVDDVVVMGLPPHATQQEICACVIVAPGSGETVENLRRSYSNMRACGELECSIKHIVILKKFPRLPNGRTNKLRLLEIIRDKYNIE